MAAILADTSNRVVVCCGAGGVGKTTTAAAMALRAAEYGRTVVVLTIDPAKRLAQALGIKDLGNTPQRVPLAPEVHRRAARDDARHAPHLRRDGAPVLRTRTRTKRFWTTSSIKPWRRRWPARRSTWRWRSSASFSPRTNGIWSSSTPRRRATRWTSSTRPNGWAASWTAGCGGCCWRPGRGIGRLVTGAVGLAMKALSTVLGSQMLSDAAGFRPVAGCDVRRVPGEGRPHLRAAQAARHPVRRGVGGRARRAARGVVLRRPAVPGAHAAGRADPQPHPSDAVRPARRQGRRGGRGARRRRIPTRWPRRCCGSTPTAR